jgi:hypothetical protein
MQSFTVIESIPSISGRTIVVGLRCLDSKPTINSTLSSAGGELYEVTKEDTNIRDRWRKYPPARTFQDLETIFVFVLRGIAHKKWPTEGECLFIVAQTNVG